MKQKLTIIILFFVCLASPQTFLSQTNSKSQKAAKTSKSKTDRGKLQAKKIIEQFIDGVFVERKTLATFDRFVRFDICDKVDKSVFAIGCTFPELSKNLGFKTNSRISAMIWRFVYGRYALQIGIYPITESTKLAYPYSAPNYEMLKSSIPDFDDFVSDVIKKNKSPELDFESLGSDGQDIEKRLDVMERDADEIETLIYNSIDKSVFKKNIEIMKSTIEVEKENDEGRTYYSVSFGEPDIGFYLAVRKGKMKIIGLFDSI
jgi:hypothetical protein